MTSPKVPKAMQGVYDTVVSLTDEVCRNHLNEEYAELFRTAAAALARKRPSPLQQGQPASWAVGIAYAIGRVNFLFAPDATPHFTVAKLAALFGVSQATAFSKGKVVQQALKISDFSYEWLLRSRIAQSPFIWMISVDGFIVDARKLPRSLQELACEKGLIPFVPEEEDLVPPSRPAEHPKDEEDAEDLPFFN